MTSTFLWIMSASAPIAWLVGCRDLGYSVDPGAARRRYTTEWRVHNKVYDTTIVVEGYNGLHQENIDRERAMADFNLLKGLGLNPLAVVGRFEWPPVSQANVFPVMGVGLQ